jgi:hypothetical protein
MAGIGESRVDGIENPYVLMSDNAANLALNIDAGSNQVGATANVFDRFGQNAIVDSYLLTFGSDGATPGNSAFVDNDRFGAIQTNDPNDMRLRTDGANQISAAQNDKGFPHLYLVSGRASPVAGYEHCNSCEFLDWGWWGQRLDFEGDGSEFSGVRTDFVHLGTWVAGDITNPASLPTDISVDYAGTALGTVSRQTADGVAKYIARGDMNMSFDFSTRTGSMDIRNFDGMSASGLISENSSATQALFNGGLAGVDGLHGSVQGAFVNDGPNVAAGVIGNFGLTNGAGLSASGTIAGARVP